MSISVLYIKIYHIFNLIAYKGLFYKGIISHCHISYIGRFLLIVLHNSLVCCLKFVNFRSYNAYILTEKFLLTLYF